MMARSHGHDQGAAVLACVAGFLGCALARGVAQFLTNMPRPFMIATALVVLIGLLQISRSTKALRASGLSLLAGACAAMVLPAGSIAAPSGVVTSSPGSGFAGDLFVLLDRLDEDPKAVLGERFTVSGEWNPATKSEAATVSRRIMACCAADSIAVGLDVFSERPYTGLAGSIVVVSGVLYAHVRRGELRYALTRAIVKAQR
jgi:hypothetical protein